MVEWRKGKDISAVVLGTLITFGAVTGCSGTDRPWDWLNRDPKPAASAGLLSPEVRSLIEQLKVVEGGYRSEALKDLVAREQHLGLAARFYAFQQGETRTPEELVRLINWLPARAYDRRFPPTSFAVIDGKTTQIFVREEGFAFTRQGVEETLGGATYASALSAARLIYEQQWNFHEGMKNKKTPDDDPSWYRYFPERLRLRAVYGFALEFTDPNQMSDDMMETVFSTQSVMSMERRFFGVKADLRLPESGNRGDLNRLINIGVKRVEELFERKPEWEYVFREFHQKSDFLGFARFLGSRSSLGFPSQLERDWYGMEVVKSLINDIPLAEEIFKEYLANLR